MNRKTTTLIIFITLFAATGAGAVDATTNITDNNVRPDTQNIVGTIALNVSNTSAELVDITTNTLPFSANYSQTNGTLNQGNHTVNVSVTVPAGIQPDTYNAQSVFSFDNHPSISVDWEIVVPPNENWTIIETRTQRNVSVGTTGQLGNVTVQNTGNVPVTFRPNVSGNLSRYVNLPPTVTAYPGRNTTTVMDVQIPRDTPFGRYRGVLTLSSSNANKTANISTRFLDTEPPRIIDTGIISGMATTSLHHTVTVRDNLDVGNVSATYIRETPVTRNNTTVIENQSITTNSFTKKSNTDRWTAQFSNTQQNGTYYANITVMDAAGNTVSTVKQFNITRLDATKILVSNIRLDSFPVKDEVSKDIVINDIETPVVFNLSRFSYFGNSTVDVGIIKPGDETPTYFDGGRITGSAEGVYTLIIDSRTSEPVQGVYEYNGVITLSVPPEHVPVPNITFSGEINSESYPEPGEIVMKEFRGFIGYDNAISEFINRFGSPEDSTGREYAYFIGRIPAEECRGDNQWNECSSIHALGEYEEAEQEAAEAKASENRAWAVAKFALFFAIFVVGGIARTVSLWGSLYTNRSRTVMHTDLREGDTIDGN